MSGRRLFGSCPEQPLSQQCYFHRHSRQKLAKERIVRFYCCCGTEQWSCQLYQCLGCTLRHFWQARPHSQSFCVCVFSPLSAVCCAALPFPNWATIRNDAVCSSCSFEGTYAGSVLVGLGDGHCVLQSWAVMPCVIEDGVSMAAWCEHVSFIWNTSSTGCFYYFLVRLLVNLEAVVRNSVSASALPHVLEAVSWDGNLRVSLCCCVFIRGYLKLPQL